MRVVEHLDGAPLSHATPASWALLAELARRAVLVPVTTRTAAQQQDHRKDNDDEFLVQTAAAFGWLSALHDKGVDVSSLSVVENADATLTLEGSLTAN